MKDSLKKLRSGALTFPLLLAGVVVVYFLFLKKMSTSNSQPTPQSVDPSPMDGMIIRELAMAGIDSETGRMWAAVARHETDTYKSEVFRKAQNLFGMKKPKTRPTLATDQIFRVGSNDYATYPNPNTSVRDLVMYMREFGYPASFNSPAALVSYMKSKGYFGDSLENYTRGVEYHFKKIV